MKYLFKNFICKIRGHKLSPAGTCPFTRLTYSYCEKCDSLIAKANE